jgi:signal recognition particle subunit SRP54
MFNFLTNKISDIFGSLTGKNKLTAGNIDVVLNDIKDSLLQADVPYQVVEQLVGEVKNEVLGQKVLNGLNPGEQFIKIFHDRLKEFLGGSASFSAFQIPSIIMVMGLQGSGKTTTIAKLAHYVKELALKKGKERKILLGSVDFYRPAAIEQLEILSKQVGVDFYRPNTVDPIQAASAICEKWRAGGYDYLFLDTAGRLHVDSSMLHELRQIDSNLSPKYKLLILDAMTGQESLKVAEAFEQAVGFNGAVLTKMDSEALGGAALAFRYMLKKPVYFTGVGEKIDDLEQFYPDRIATKLVGMGDLQTLMEKAQDKLKLSEQDQNQSIENFKNGRLSLDDFAQQLEMVSKMGSMSKIMQYMPGLSGVNLTPEMVQKGDLEVKRFKSILSSMTAKERRVPQVLDASRKQRIAKGAGVNVQEVNYLLQKFEQSAQFVKLFKKQGNFKNMFKF